MCGVEPQAYLTDVLTGRILSNYRRCAI
ncbi:transposase domain-containing protein [Bradyrhizobium elkanii]|uniref:Transposase domain-containing protein n=1 Tax=Bradyrhizobium barranii subsp. barranii TaxID=2823807 RepID=A0A9X9YFT2_9BRAD|nr:MULTISPECIES: transposase domain-containing protein [Bradyrhizobium]UGX89787.1 transposase domain-containing protein [Bradyrhizobium barranii subsp. barranii]